MSMFFDPNNIDFRESWPAAGAITLLSHEAPNLLLGGAVDNSAFLGNTPTAVIVLDASRRLLAAHNVRSGPFQITLPDRHLTTNTWPLSAYLYDPVSNVAQPLLFSAPSSTLEHNSAVIPSFKERYIEQVVEALRNPYTSISCFDGIKTGNGYQSVDLDKLGTVGGRPARNLFFQHVKFAGKRVLDIGANTGELSRLARRRGAALVDGYEYDPFFVETGRILNAVTGATRVSLFQGDATDRRLYDGMKYDVVLAFAVWVYIERVLDKLAEITNVVFFETHTLDHGMDMYIKPMIEYFPHFRLMGHDQNPDMRKSRAVLMFAKSASDLEDALAFVRLRTEQYFDNTFFKVYPKTTPSQFPSYVAEFSRAVAEDKAINGLGTPYFEYFLAGYHEYTRCGGVTSENIFLKKYRDAIRSGAIDSALTYLLEDEGRLIAKVERKYADVDDAIAGRWNLIPPVIVRRGDGPLSFSLESGEKFTALNIDGHHRFFIAQLLSRPTVEALIQEPLAVSRKLLQTHYKIAG